MIIGQLFLALLTQSGKAPSNCLCLILVQNHCMCLIPTTSLVWGLGFSHGGVQLVGHVPDPYNQLTAAHDPVYRRSSIEASSECVYGGGLRLRDRRPSTETAVLLQHAASVPLVCSVLRSALTSHIAYSIFCWMRRWGTSASDGF